MQGTKSGNLQLRYEPALTATPSNIHPLVCVVKRFVGRGFSRDINAPVITGALAPEGRKHEPQNRRWAERAELYPWSSANGQFLLDPSRFEELQGLKPQGASESVVAAKAATYKA
jgi:hypothetical protein